MNHQLFGESAVVPSTFANEHNIFRKEITISSARDGIDVAVLQLTSLRFEGGRKMKEFSSQLQGSNFRGVRLKETQPTRTLPLPDATTESAVRSRVVTNLISFIEKRFETLQECLVLSQQLYLTHPNGQRTDKSCPFMATMLFQSSLVITDIFFKAWLKDLMKRHAKGNGKSSKFALETTTMV